MKAKYKLISYILNNLALINESLLECYSDEDNDEEYPQLLNDEIYAQNLLKNFFYYYDFPDDLFAIKTACENIERMFVILSDLSRQEDRYIIEQWKLVVCVFRLDVVDREIVRLVKVLYADEKSEINTPQGHLVAHPLYGVIRLGTTDSSNLEQYFHLKSHLHMAWPILMRKGVSHNFLVNLGRAARRLGKADHNEVLSALPNKICSQEKYKQSLQAVNDDKEVGASGKHFLKKIIYAFDIEDGTEVFTPKEGGNKYGNRDGGGEIQGVLPQRLIISSIESTGINIEDIDDISQLKVKSGGEDGAESDDYQLTTDDRNSSNEVFIVKPNQKKFLNLDSKKIALQLKGEMQAIHKYQQILPTDNNQISIFEVAALLFELTKAWETGRDNNNYNDVRLVLIVAIILFYGRSIDDVIDLRIYTEVHDYLVHGVNISYSLYDNAFLVRPLLPKVKWNLNEDERSQAIPVESYLKLNCCEVMNEMILFLWNQPGKKYRAGKIFSDITNKSLVKGMNLLFKELNDEHNTLLTYSKVYKHMFHEVTRKSTDIVDGGLITGQKDSRAASQGSYTTRSCTVLSTIHVGIIKNIVGDSGKEFNLPFDGWLSSIYHSNYYVGSKFTPKQETVKKLISGILLRMKELDKREGSWLVEYHNLYTAYTLLMFDFATGHRSVTNKFCFPYEVDLINKHCLAAEKDGDDYFNDRIVPFPVICCEQYKHYNEYRKIIIGRLIGVPDIDKKWHKLKLFKSRKENQKCKFSIIGHFFFLNDKHEPMPIKPSGFHKIIDIYYSLKLDTNRHYIRSFLREKNYPGEKIDAVIGHWLSGQNPNSRYSTSVIGDVLNEINDLISMRMKEDGWMLHEGPLK